MIETYNQIDRTIKNLLTDFINSGIEPIDSQLRQIQDLFYLQRIVPNDVPGLFYKWWKGISSETARSAIKLSKNEILNKPIHPI